MSHHVIDFKNISFSYPDGKKAISNVNLRFLHGESIGLVGANGAGKSTLLMLLAGILEPSEGEIVFGDTPINKKTLPYIRQRLGFTFQNPDDQLFMNTIYEDVAFGPRNYGFDEETVNRRVLQALERVNILELKDRPPYKLSGGEKRSASIATVLAMEPDVLVMDEPSNALDPRSRRRLINLLKEFTHTKIIASHDLDLVLDICERVVIIKDGRVAHDGNAVDILSDESILESCSLELPLSMQKR